MRPSYLVIALLLTLACLAQAQQTSALIGEALDQPINLQLKGTLPAAMEQITSETGVRLVATPDVWDLLPWGQESTITATIENQTLRQALTDITHKFGLTYELKDEYIELRPIGALRRLGRRATPQELAALDLLATTPIEMQENRPGILKLLATIDNKLADEKTEYAVENRAFNSGNSQQEIPLARHATMLDALDAIDTNTDATWYPWGQSIVILSKQDAISGLLNKTISLRYDSVDIAQVLLELSQRAGIAFTIEPGALQRISPEFRSIRLFLDNASIRQAMESICGITGLQYIITRDGLYFSNPSTARTGGRDPIVGILNIPDLNIQILVPQSQVSDELRAYLQHKMDEQLRQLTKQMHEEGFTAPTIQPMATQP